jgi:hypothetical protein
MEFSYDFEVLSAGKSHPFSFTGLTIVPEMVGQWSNQWAATPASVG